MVGRAHNYFGTVFDEMISRQKNKMKISADFYSEKFF